MTNRYAITDLFDILKDSSEQTTKLYELIRDRRKSAMIEFRRSGNEILFRCRKKDFDELEKVLMSGVKLGGHVSVLVGFSGLSLDGQTVCKEILDEFVDYLDNK